MSRDEMALVLNFMLTPVSSTLVTFQLFLDCQYSLIFHLNSGFSLFKTSTHIF